MFDDYDLAELTTRIDWTPFFRTWELAGTYPAILEDSVIGAAARDLKADADVMLQRIIGEGWLQAKAVIGFWPANSQGDDVVLDVGGRPTKLHFLRQQMKKRDGQANMCLADFVAPQDTGLTDYVGGFCVTAGLNIDQKLHQFQAAHDDYNDILLKALADRLAEAFAERMHERVRQEFWGHAANERFSNDELIAEKYRGIRPAPGYPACPDHQEKATLFQLLDAPGNVGVELTESFAMMPTASVSGFYFGHPDAKYFGVGRISKDQVEDYAKRRSDDLVATERWLAPNLIYERA